jgi:hypothetical protein
VPKTQPVVDAARLSRTATSTCSRRIVGRALVLRLRLMSACHSTEPAR